MSRWYRAYEGTVTDAKLGEVAMIAGCSRSVAVASWHAILEACATVNDAGRFDITARRLAVILCEPLDLMTAVLAAFDEIGMTHAGTVPAWSKRQFESDDAAARMRKLRQRRKDEQHQGSGEPTPDGDAHVRNGDEHVRPHRQRQSTETEKKETASQTSGEPPVAPEQVSTPDPLPDPRAELFGRGLKALVALTGKAEPPARTLLGRWLKDADDEAVAVLEAIDRAVENRPADATAWISGVLRQRKQSRAPPPQRQWYSV